MRFTLCLPENVRIEAHLALPGHHNVLNALAAAAIGWQLGIATETIATALEKFKGIGRRFNQLAELSLANGGAVPGSLADLPEVNSAIEAIAVFLASAVLALVLNRLKVPAGTFLGAMVTSAALHATGLVHGRFPPALVILGFVATGAVIGARFRGTTMTTVMRTLPGASVSILLALFVSAVFATLGAWLLGLPFGQLWLALAPGGVEAMAAMALAV